MVSNKTKWEIHNCVVEAQELLTGIDSQENQEVENAIYKAQKFLEKIENLIIKNQ